MNKNDRFEIRLAKLMAMVPAGMIISRENVLEKLAAAIARHPEAAKPHHHEFLEWLKAKREVTKT